MAGSGIFRRDANHVPIADDGVTVTKSVTLTASNTTASEVLFTITGSVEVRALYGVVTTAIGANHTAAHWRLNDQTAQPVISLVTGTTLSAIPAGSMITRRSLVSVALVSNSSAAGVVGDPVAATAPSYFMPFVLVKKTGALTQVEYRYTTTETPTTGAIKFYMRWIPLSDDANVVAA
jgi:hypothetical protein